MSWKRSRVRAVELGDRGHDPEDELGDGGRGHRAAEIQQVQVARAGAEQLQYLDRVAEVAEG